MSAARTRPHWSRNVCSTIATTQPPGAPRPRHQGGPPGSARPARSQRRGRRPRTPGSRRALPWSRRTAVGGQRLAVLHPHRGCRLGGIQPEAGGDARRLVDRLVIGEHGLLLVLRKGRPRLRRPRRRGRALVDQQHVLHVPSFRHGVVHWTNGTHEIDSLAKERWHAPGPLPGSISDLTGCGSRTRLREGPTLGGPSRIGRPG